MPEDTMIGRYVAARERATANGDRNLVAEIDFQLQRLGYREGQSATVERAEAKADAEAVPRGRANRVHRDAE